MASSTQIPESSTAPTAGTQLDPINVKTIRGCAVYFVALHEAGHAVIAAHLRLPFHHVTVIPDNESEGQVRMKVRTGSRLRKFVQNRDGSYRARTDEELKAIFHRQSTLHYTKHAVMTLAARAVCEGYGFIATEFEPGYVDDEETLRKCFEWSSPNECFDQWRSRLLDEARDLVTVPYIAEAIFTLTILLQMASHDGRGIPAKAVRTMLNAEKSYDALSALLEEQKTGANE